MTETLQSESWKCLKIDLRRLAVPSEILKLELKLCHCQFYVCDLCTIIRWCNTVIKDLQCLWNFSNGDDAEINLIATFTYVMQFELNKVFANSFAFQ